VPLYWEWKDSCYFTNDISPWGNFLYIFFHDKVLEQRRSLYVCCANFSDTRVHILEIEKSSIFEMVLFQCIYSYSGHFSITCRFRHTVWLFLQTCCVNHIQITDLWWCCEDLLGKYQDFGEILCLFLRCDKSNPKGREPSPFRKIW
jgi:hypothetical protein